MKKAILSLGILACLAVSVSAAEPVTLADRADKLDMVVYGTAKTGALTERIDALDQDVYGNSSGQNGLDQRISSLYADVVKDSGSSSPSLVTRVNTMEYYLTDEIKQDALVSRVDGLETKVFGQSQTGALDTRVDALEKAVYGNMHFELTPVELPANTVFKISLNEDVNTKTNAVGDEVHFTVQEDVRAGDVLVLPRGSQGSGIITKVVGPRSFGRSGSLEISFNQVFSIDDDSIPTVLGTESKEKLKKEAAAVGASALGAMALGPVGLIGGFFVKGSDVDMPAGTELYIQTQETVQTRGMKLTAGAPKAGSSVHSSAVKSESGDTTQKTGTVASSAIASSHEQSGDTAVQNTGGTEKEESAQTADNSASVVIIRNE